MLVSVSVRQGYKWDRVSGRATVTNLQSINQAIRSKSQRVNFTKMRRRILEKMSSFMKYHQADMSLELICLIQIQPQLMKWKIHHLSLRNNSLSMANSLIQLFRQGIMSGKVDNILTNLSIELGLRRSGAILFRDFCFIIRYVEEQALDMPLVWYKD